MNRVAINKASAAMCPVLLAACAFVPCSARGEAASDAGAAVRQAFLEQHCIACHDADSREGGFDATGLRWQPDDAESLARWAKVHDRVARGEMPPPDEERPPLDQRTLFLDTLGGGLKVAGRLRQARVGRTVQRRLNRNEYVTTVHDLLGIDTPLAELLPEDGTAGGFDTIGEALELSPVHLERYLEAASAALAAATVATPRPEPRTIRTDYNETWHDWGSPGFQKNQWTHSPEGFLAIR